MQAAEAVSGSEPAAVLQLSFRLPAAVSCSALSVAEIRCAVLHCSALVLSAVAAVSAGGHAEFSAEFVRTAVQAARSSELSHPASAAGVPAVSCLPVLPLPAAVLPPDGCVLAAALPRLLSALPAFAAVLLSVASEEPAAASFSELLLCQCHAARSVHAAVADGLSAAQVLYVPAVLHPDVAVHAPMILSVSADELCQAVSDVFPALPEAVRLPPVYSPGPERPAASVLSEAA